MAEKQPDQLSELKQENADLKDRLTNLERYLAHREPVLSPAMQQKELEAKMEKVQTEICRPAQVITQEIADKRWQEAKKYPVKVVHLKTGKTEIPEIFVPARNPEEAQGRYNVLCGILSVDNREAEYIIGQPIGTAQATAAVA